LLNVGPQNPLGLGQFSHDRPLLLRCHWLSGHHRNRPGQSVDLISNLVGPVQKLHGRGVLLLHIATQFGVECILRETHTRLVQGRSLRAADAGLDVVELLYQIVALLPERRQLVGSLACLAARAPGTEQADDRQAHGADNAPGWPNGEHTDDHGVPPGVSSLEGRHERLNVAEKRSCGQPGSHSGNNGSHYCRRISFNSGFRFLRRVTSQPQSVNSPTVSDAGGAGRRCSG